MILRWQDEADSISGDRWIILIAYIIGLSIGVHLLNLLCIPAIVLVFYYRKYQAVSLKGSDRNDCAVRSSYCIDSLCLYTRNG